MSQIFVQPEEQVIVVQPAESTVTLVEPDHIEVVEIPVPQIEVKSTGIIGPPGVSAGSEVIINGLEAGSVFSGQRIVVPDTGGFFVYADPFNIDHLNRPFLLTQTAIMIGDHPDLLADGEFEEPTWNWNEGDALFLGASGTLVTTPPLGAVFLVKLALVVKSTKIYFHPSEPIQLT